MRNLYKSVIQRLFALPGGRKVLFALILLTVFGLGHVSGYMTRAVRAQNAEPPEFALFWEAWTLVEDYFVDRDEVASLDMTYGAIRGMLASLGDENHTVFFTPEEAVQQADSLEGSFEGIGAYVGTEDGLFKILSPIHGSPAEAAGLLPGDIVLEVDGEDIFELEDWEVISLIRGPAGSQVTLTILREDVDEPFQVAVTRDRIDVESVLWARIPGSELAYVQITQFAADTGPELERTLLAIEAASQESPIRGIVLDLRNNPGGYLQQAIQVGSQFLEKDAVILYDRDAAGETRTYRAYGREGLARTIPVVALVNEGSASAAEILAGALQANDRAKIVGATTLGTGTVLRPFQLSDGSVIRLGVTNWLTPDRELIKGEGIHPDVAVEQPITTRMVDSLMLDSMSAEGLYTHEDRQFASALLLLRLQVNQAEATPITSAP
ncbi:MAG: S41 family peptidase [Caldilineaceae bacterium]|nr:S41 family peptidase [Caldilineaceae bacterium]